MGSAIFLASGPASRTTPMPPQPGGVAMATMVSSRCTRLFYGLGRLAVLYPRRSFLLGHNAVGLVKAGEAGLHLFVDAVHLAVQLRDFQLGLEVYFIIQISFEAIFGGLAVLRHHDHRRLQRRQHGE